MCGSKICTPGSHIKHAQSNECSPLQLQPVSVWHRLTLHSALPQKVDPPLKLPCSPTLTQSIAAFLKSCAGWAHCVGGSTQWQMSAAFAPWCRLLVSHHQAFPLRRPMLPSFHVCLGYWTDIVKAVHVLQCKQHGEERRQFVEIPDALVQRALPHAIVAHAV